MRLLIAEDEKHLNKTLNERLTKAGYTVDSCFDGEDALVNLSLRVLLRCFSSSAIKSRIKSPALLLLYNIFCEM